MATETILQDVRPWGGSAVDLHLRGGVIAEVRPATDRGENNGARVYRGGGRLALPSFSDVHVHLDSTRIGLPFRPHSAEPGPLWNMIANDRAHWRDAEASVSDRATETLGRAITHGLTRARSYAQVDADCRLERLEGVLSAREHHAARAEVEVVAFPQAGLLLEPGVPELIEAALDQGADIVGGIDPCALDADPKQHLDIVFDIAHRRGVRVDIHLHEPGELGLFSFGQIVERITALDYRGMVTVAHAFFLSDVTPAQRARVIDQLREWDIAITTIAPSGHAPLPLRDLIAGGVRLGLGQDGQRDYWSPYGNTDMLDRTWQLAFTNGLRRDSDIEDALDVASLGGARVMDRAAAFSGRGRGLGVGDPADIVLVPGETPTSAVMDRPSGRTVLHRGVIVADEGALL